MKIGKTKRLLLLPLWIIGGMLALLALLSVSAQVILSPRVSEKLINRFAPEIIDGQVSMSSASISVFRHFPRFTADIDNLIVTYPSSRFAASKAEGEQGRLVFSGNYVQGQSPQVDEPMDTLASFRHFTASVNPFALLGNQLRFNDVSLYRPRVHLHKYQDGTSNLDIVKLRLGPDDSKDSESDFKLRLFLKKIYLGDSPVIVYTDQAIGLMANLVLDEFAFDGRFNPYDLEHGNFKTAIENLTFAGRVMADTLQFKLDAIRAAGRNGSMDIDAAASLFLGTRKYGRIIMPVGLEGRIDMANMDGGGLHMDLHNVDLDVATVCLQADMLVEVGDSLLMRGDLRLPPLDVQKVLDDYLYKVIPSTRAISTDAMVSASLSVDGWYDFKTGQLPAFTAELDIPRCFIADADFDYVPRLELKASLDAEQGGSVNAVVDECCILAPGLDLDFEGSASDLLGEDPAISLNGRLDARLDSLGRLLAEKYDIFVGGSILADAKGSFNFSNISLYNFSNADINAKVEMKDLVFDSYDDTLSVNINNVTIRAALMDEKMRRGNRDRSLGARVEIDSVSMKYKESASLGGRNISALMRGSTDRVEFADTLRYHPMNADINIGSLQFHGEDSVYLALDSSRNILRLHPSRDDQRIPVINLRSSNGKLLGGKAGLARAMIKDMVFNAKATMTDPQRKRRLRTLMDSMNRAHPEMSRDSLRRFLADNARGEKLPQWFRADELRNRADINFKFGESFMKLYRRWNVDGTVDMDSVTVQTPLYPLRNYVTAFAGSFSNDEISIDSLHVKSGASQLSASGSVSNLKRVLDGRGTLRLKLDVGSDSLAVSEMIAAYNAGASAGDMGMELFKSADDRQVQAYLDKSMEMAGSSSRLVLLPRNLDAVINLRSRGLSYDKLNVRSFDSEILMRNRVLQILDTRMETSAGNIGLEAFYSTRHKDDVLLGFDLDMNDVLAAEVIAMVPQIDSLAPVLKSFDGRFSCNLSATANLDTLMRLKTNSLNGVVRFNGENLHFNEDKRVTSIARRLMIQNARHATIDSIMVEGVIKDNTLEIFPFLLKLENWSMAIAGIQRLDDSYDYHLSLYRSPFLIPFGANFTGSKDQKLKFKIGKTKYRNDSLPSFTEVIDNARAELVNTIHRIFDVDVNRARAAHGNMDSLGEARRRMGYSRSVALEELESMSGTDKAVLDSLGVDYSSISSSDFPGGLSD